MGYNRFYPAKQYKWHVTSMEKFREMLVRRRDNELDNLVLITGSRGIGKSTFAGKVLFGFDDFDPFASLVYSKEAMFKRVKLKRGYVWADESVVNASKGNVMTRANKLLFEAMTINRDNFNIILFLMPFIEDFDSKILQYCSAWIHIDRRGLGVLLLPSNKGLFGRHNWDIRQLKKIYDEFMKETKGLSHVPFWIFDNFRGYIKFGKLTDKQKEIVNEIKQLKKNENLDQEFKDVEIKVHELDNYTKYSAKNLAELTMKGEIRSIEQFNKTCEEMKLDPIVLLKKCDSILKRNNLQKTMKQVFRELEKKDSLINF